MCEHEGGYLANVISEADNIVLTRLINRMDPDRNQFEFYIGLQRVGTKFRWTTANGSDITFPNWVPGEPNNKGGRENCAVMQSSYSTDNGKWNDVNCMSTYVTYRYNDGYTITKRYVPLCEKNIDSEDPTGLPEDQESNGGSPFLTIVIGVTLAAIGIAVLFGFVCIRYFKKRRVLKEDNMTAKEPCNEDSTIRQGNNNEVILEAVQNPYYGIEVTDIDSGNENYADNEAGVSKIGTVKIIENPYYE